MSFSHSDYSFKEEISISPTTQVIRVCRNSDQKNFIIKLSNSSYPTVTDVIRYQFEFDLLQLFNTNRIIKGLEFEKNYSKLMLVLEDYGGVSLESFWNGRQLTNYQEFLEIAVQMAQALVSTHAKNVIHKDINLQNFLIHPESREIKLIDFNLATLLGRENSDASSVNHITGTLEYLSPEQTGRMNRSLDFRTDLYSIGVCFYRIVTGGLPFEGTDPLEVIHGHLAKKPTPIQLRNPSCPLVIVRIIERLMSKSADERYQSAIGLQKDLEKCLIFLKSNKVIPDFDICEEDRQIIFEVSQKIFGREKESQILFEEFERVSKGQSGLIMIGGYSGIGKTALVNEVHKPLVQKKANFTSGKFDQFNRNIPYSALVDALNSLVQIFASEKSEKREYWKKTIQNALGANGKVIVDIIPSLEWLIGPQESVQLLGPTEAHLRLQRVFNDFLQSLASESHPLVIFLDDLQWADSSSLLLLEYILSQNSKFVLFIVAYRDNEVSVDHPFILMTDSLKKVGVSIKSILLNPLSERDIQNLLCSTLKRSDEAVTVLAKLLAVKTGGNPFFLVQQLYNLFERKLIYLDASDYSWNWDYSKIQKIGLSDNIIDLLTKKIATLPEETKELVRIASFLGNKFDIQSLILVSQKSFQNVIKNLWPALKEGILESRSENYSFSEMFSSESKIFLNESNVDWLDNVQLEYKFLHDKVQQASYFLTPTESLPTDHLNIGRRLLLGFYNKDENGKHSLFDIVNHFNRGEDLITDQKEQSQVAELNYLAGKKAKASTALKVADEYFRKALKLFGNDLWNLKYEIALDLNCELVEIEYLIGNLIASVDRANETLKFAKTPYDKGRVYTILVPLYSSKGDRKSLETALEALKVFNIVLPEDPKKIAELNVLELNQIQEYFNLNSVDELYHHAALSDDSIRLLMKLLVDFWVAAYFCGHPEYMTYAVYKIVNLSLEFGHTDASALGFALYSSICRVGEENYVRSDELGRLSVELIEKFPNAVYKARLCNIYGHVINPYFRRIGTSKKYFEESYRIGPEVGEVLWAVWAAFFVSIIRNLNGDSIDSVLDESYKFSSFLEKSNDKAVFYSHRIHQQILLGYLGKTKAIDSIDSADFCESEIVGELEKMQAHFALLWHSAFRSQSYVINRQYQKAYTLTKNADYALNYDIGLITSTNHIFFQSIAIYQIYNDIENSVRNPEMLELLKRNLAKFKMWSTYGAINFQHRYLFLLAEENRIFGDGSKVVSLYKRAIVEAEQNNFPQDVGLFCELAAMQVSLIEDESLKAELLKKSHDFYSIWGAAEKKKIIRKELSQLGLLGKLERENSIVGADVNLLSVIKAMQTISSEIDQNKLILKLIKILMEGSGAEKALLILESKNDYRCRFSSMADKIIEIDQSVDESNQAIKSIVRIVLNSKKTLIVDDAFNDMNFSSDNYVIENRIRSVMCVPMMSQSRLLGVVYLENNLIDCAFSQNHKLTIEMIATQAGISIDIASLYRDMEIRIEEKTEELKQAQAQVVNSSKMSALGEMSGGIAHEINTPLAVIKLSSDLIRKMFLGGVEKIDSGKALKLIETIDKTTIRISKIIQGLRTFSRDASQDPTQVVFVKDVIDGTISLCSARFREGQVELKVEPFRSDLSFEGREVEISQVLLNLLNNSYDAIGKLDEKWIKIQVDIKNNYIQIRVIDSGLGISSVVEEKLFQPFFTTKDIGFGTGLGLSISLGIVKKHNGNIWIDKANRNTCFVVELPKK